MTRHVEFGADGAYVNAIMIDPQAVGEWPLADGHVLVAHETAGSGWRYEGGELVPPASEPEVVDLVAYAARSRWERETGGIDVGGIPVATDDRSKMMIIGARLAAEANPGFTTRWKTLDGTFVDLSAAQLIAISDAVLAHVDACFAIEANVIADIADEEITTTEEIDAAFG